MTKSIWNGGSYVRGKVMHKLLFILLPLVACTGCQQSSSAGSPVGEPLKPSLVYISNRGEGFNIYKNDPEGNEEVQLTSDPGWEWYPQWNQEDTYILINTQDTSGVFEMKCLDTQGNYQAFQGKKESSYQLSPNGNWGAYTLQENDTTRLWIFPMENPIDSVLIASEGAYNGRPEWSPDERQILYLSDRSGTNELYLYTLESQETKGLARTIGEKNIVPGPLMESGWLVPLLRRISRMIYT